MHNSNQNPLFLQFEFHGKTWQSEDNVIPSVYQYHRPYNALPLWHFSLGPLTHIQPVYTAEMCWTADALEIHNRHIFLDWIFIQENFIQLNNVSLNWSALGNICLLLGFVSLKDTLKPDGFKVFAAMVACTSFICLKGVTALLLRKKNILLIQTRAGREWHLSVNMPRDYETYPGTGLSLCKNVPNVQLGLCQVKLGHAFRGPAESYTRSACLEHD